VPAAYFFWGAAIALVASFVALGALWRRPLLEPHSAGRALPGPLSRTILSRTIRIALGALAAVLLVLIFVAALVGKANPNENVAPTFVWVIFWLGLVPVTVLLGNVWSALDPWRAIADATVWLLERAGVEPRPLAVYPERLGRLPAAALLFCFAALELAYKDPASPRALALAIGLYSYVTFFGMAAYGRATWLDRGEAFSVYFGLLARVAPFAAREGRVVLRWPFTGLAGAARTPGTLLFVSVMLGSVGFDGFSRTSAWQNLIADVQDPYVLDRPELGQWLASGVNLLGLVAAVAFVYLAYRGAVALSRHSVHGRESLVHQFVFSLVPIALVYAVAHYFSLLVIQGPFIVPLAGDPLGRGWDLLGLATYVPSREPLTPNAVWYVQVGALVAGHVAGLAVAHDRAVTLFRERGAALRSQVALLGLMVLYTVGGLWVLSQG